MKLKKVKNVINACLIALFIMLQGFMAAGILFYKARTNINSEISVYSEQPCVIILQTPLWNEITINVPAKDTVHIPKRPLYSAEVPAQSGLEWHQCDENTNNESFSVSFSDCERISVSDILVFFVALKYHYLWVLAGILPLALLLFLNFVKIKNLFFVIKSRILKLIAKNKPDADTIKLYTKGIQISRTQHIHLLIIALFCFVSFFTGIGKECLHQGESGKWRALVSLEMKYSDNYVVPTLNGEYYYNKPPLFNYLLLPFANAENNPEFKLRSVTVISVIILCLIIYFIGKEELNKRGALFSVLLFATSGSVYFVFSTRLMLDPFFALLIVTMFYFNFRFAKHEKYMLMFVVGYFLAFLGFMTKGLPALYFQLISLISVFLVFKSFRKIISISHLTGIMAFAVPMLLYALVYSNYNDPMILADELFGEVTYKLDTSVGQKWADILSFAGKTITAYSPVMLLWPVVFKKGNLYLIFKDKFVVYSLIISFFGILAFFTGNYYPQYVLMFVPFWIIIILKFLPFLKDFSVRQKIVMIGIDALMVMLAYIFQYNFIFVYSLIYLLFITIVVFLPVHFFGIFTIAFYLLIILRLSFLNPMFKSNYPEKYLAVKSDAEELIKKAGGVKLLLYPEDIEVNHATMYYLTYYNKEIIYSSSELSNKDAGYLTLRSKLPPDAIVVDSVIQRVNYRHPDPYGEFYVDEWLILFKLQE